MIRSNGYPSPAPYRRDHAGCLCVALIVGQAPQVIVHHQHPAHVTPKEIDQRAVRIRALIGMFMVPAMNRHPVCRGVLETANPQKGESVFKPLRADETAVGEQR